MMPDHKLISENVSEKLFQLNVFYYAASQWKALIEKSTEKSIASKLKLKKIKKYCNKN